MTSRPLRSLLLLPACAGLATSAALVACGGGEAPNAASSAAGTAASDTRITFAAGARARATATTTATDVVIYVSPTGDDGWSGAQPTSDLPLLDGPKRTIAGAQLAARARIADMVAGRATRQAVRVKIQPGTYVLPATLAFNETDSGAAGYPVSYEATVPGQAVISGGATLLQAADVNGAASFTLPAGFSPTWTSGQQLYVNGRRATLARQPDAGTSWFVTRAVTTSDEVPPDVGRTAFAPTADALAWINALKTGDRSRAILDVYQSWTTGRHRIATGAPAGAVRIAPKALWPFLAFGANQRFFVENVRAAFDSAGEWIGDPAGINYLRRPDDPASVTAVMPALDELLRIKGDASTGRWVQYLEFHGLSLQHQRYLTPSAGVTDFQAGIAFNAAVDVDGARYLTIDGCSIAHTGGHGIWLRQNVRGAKVTNNTLSDLGAGGIRVGLATQPATDPNPTGANTVSGNTVTDLGHVWPGAVGIWVGQSFDNTVSKNLVANTTYSGISVGWTWGYDSTDSGRNSIASNLLYNIGQGQLADMGGIYTVGISPGTTITNNVIREVRGYPGYGGSGAGGAWGVFGDEGTSQVTMSGNVIVGTDNGAYRLNFGRSNTLQGNFLAWGDTSEVGLHLSDPANTHLTLTDNLLVPIATQAFDGYATSPDMTDTGTVVSSANVMSGPPDLSKCLPGCVLGTASLTTTAYPTGITVIGASPTMAATISSTLANAGPTGSPLLSQPGVARRPPPDMAPPLPLDLDIANTPLGGRPGGLTYSMPGAPSAIQVVAMSGAPANGKCLQFADAPTFANYWDPHAFATLNYTGGTATATFKLLVDANATFSHEWRDNASPYRVGPSFRVTSRGVEIGGIVKIALPANTWNTFTVTAPLGSAAGTWNLTVVDAQGVAHALTGLANGTSTWKELDWLGFISLANATTSSCLGQLTVSDAT